MKKFILSATLVASALLGVNAQTLSFQVGENGEKIATGSTYTHEGWEMFGNVDSNGFTGYAIVTIDPDIYIVSTDKNKITVQTTLIAGGEYQLCAGGDCVKGNLNDPVIIKPEVAIEGKEPLNLRLEAILTFMNAIVEIPSYEILVEAWYDATPANKVSFTLKMGDVDAGVDSIADSGNSVKVSGKTLTYDLVGASSLQIYDLNGKTQLNCVVSGSGSIDLAELPKGVYVYKVAGKRGLSGKFVIE